MYFPYILFLYRKSLFKIVFGQSLFHLSTNYHLFKNAAQFWASEAQYFVREIFYLQLHVRYLENMYEMPNSETRNHTFGLLHL